MRTLITGGSGLLARHLKIEADRPSHQELDITKPVDYWFYEHPIAYHPAYDLIIHCAAYTDVQKAETDKLDCFDLNVRGTLNLLNAYPDVPFVYISSEYAKNPVNFYSWTKRWGENLVESHLKHLIIRTLFKATPWPFDKAFVDQYTNGDYVDVIAPLIEKAIEEWDRTSKIIYIGTGRKTIYELAKRTKPDVVPNSIKEMKVPVPSDYD